MVGWVAVGSVSRLDHSWQLEENIPKMERLGDLFECLGPVTSALEQYEGGSERFFHACPISFDGFGEYILHLANKTRKQTVGKDPLSDSPRSTVGKAYTAR